MESSSSYLDMRRHFVGGKRGRASIFQARNMAKPGFTTKWWISKRKDQITCPADVRSINFWSYKLFDTTNIFVPGYLGIMVTRQQQFCCIFAGTKDKFDYFLKKLFHSSTSHTYHHNSSLFLNRHKNLKSYLLSLSQSNMRKWLMIHCMPSLTIIPFSLLSSMGCRVKPRSIS